MSLIAIIGVSLFLLLLVGSVVGFAVVYGYLFTMLYNDSVTLERRIAARKQCRGGCAPGQNLIGAKHGLGTDKKR